MKKKVVVEEKQDDADLDFWYHCHASHHPPNYITIYVTAAASAAVWLLLDIICNSSFLVNAYLVE